MAKSVVKSVAFPMEFETDEFKKLHKARDFNFSTLFRDGVEALYEVEKRPKRLINALERHGLSDIIADPLHYDFSSTIREAARLHVHIPNLLKWVDLHRHSMALASRAEDANKRTFINCTNDIWTEEPAGRSDNLRAIEKLFGYVPDMCDEKVMSRFRTRCIASSR